MILVSNAVIWILVIIASVTVYNEMHGMMPLLVVLFAGFLVSTATLHRQLKTVLEMEAASPPQAVEGEANERLSESC